MMNMPSVKVTVIFPITGSGIKTIATFKSGQGKCNLKRSQENLAQSFKTALSGTGLVATQFSLKISAIINLFAQAKAKSKSL